MNGSASQKSLVRYFALVFGLAVPFWIFGWSKLPLPVNLPVSALATFVPVIAALIAAYWESKGEGVRALLYRATDWHKIRPKLWYLPLLLTMPLIAVLSYGIMRLLGRPLPAPIQIPLATIPAFLALYLISDTGEELGWAGWATDPLQARWGELRCGLLLGLVWVTWHIVPWIQTGNSPVWIAWQAVFSVALRVLMVWFYNRTGWSVFAVILLHVMSNMSWSLFPNYGSHYDPMITAVFTILAAVAALVLGARRKPVLVEG